MVKHPKGFTFKPTYEPDKERMLKALCTVLTHVPSETPPQPPKSGALAARQP